MTTETRIKRSELEKFTVAQVVDDDRVRNRFVELYNSRSIRKNGEAEYIQATESFMRAIQEDANLQQCTTLSLYNAFLDMAIYGVNVAKQAQPLAYLLWNNVKTGKKSKDNKDIYEKRATLAISPYGELAIRQQRGQIKYADNPVIVYEGDEYSGIYYKNGTKMIDYAPSKKKDKGKIVAAFLKIVRTDGTIDFAEIDLQGIERLKGYSARKNRGDANALYTSNKGQIDSGFLTAKLVKHAFKTYPRIDNPNVNAVFETQQIENEVEETEDLYGVDEETGEIEETQAEEVQPEDDKESF